MFEVAEIGHKLSKKQFKALVPELHTRLLEVQRDLAKSDSSVIIIVSGVESAGKGEVVNRLNEWLDSRGIETNAFWDETDDQTMRPPFWRFWRTLPAKGSIGIMFGSWYTQPIINRVYQKIGEAEFERQLGKISEFEQMLLDDNAIIIKLWFHMPKAKVEEQLKLEEKNLKSLQIKTGLAGEFSTRFDLFVSVSERTLRETEQGQAPWHIIEATDDNYRDVTAAEIILETMEAHLLKSKRKQEQVQADENDASTGSLLTGQPTILDQVDLSQHLYAKDYAHLLENAQTRLYELCWQAREQKKSIVSVFEGWDAAGKGSAIRRVTQSIDARLYKVISIAAPTDEEDAHHYLWRFWRHIPLAGYVSIYDRSWYGRVLVERVEKFAREEEWRRAYGEINHFEEQLCEHGIIMTKFWLHISKEEQLERFEARKTIPWKMHKLTEEDWRNREKWDNYCYAIDDMVAHTSTEHAPWTLVAGNDKKFARIQVLTTLCEAIEKGLS